jgi:hypothetical protein
VVSRRTAGFSPPVNQPGTAFNQLLGINKSGTTASGYSSTMADGAALQKALTVTGGPSFASPTFTDINALLPANFNSQATGVNDAGAVVGFFLPTATTSVGFLDQGGTVTPLDPFGSTFTQALGVNNNGEIVGVEVDVMGVQHGYFDIGGVFQAFDPPGSVNTTINGVNNLGQIVGFSPTPTTTRSALSPPPPRQRCPSLHRSLCSSADCWASAWYAAGAKPPRDTNSGASLTRHPAPLEYPR